MKCKILLAVRKKWYPSIFSGKDLNRINSTCDVIKAEVPEPADKLFLLKYIHKADNEYSKKVYLSRTGYGGSI